MIRRMCWGCLLCMVALGLVFAQGTTPYLAKGVIKGTVTDKVSGNPITWVQVQLFLLPSGPSPSWVQVLTNAHGQYEASLDEGTYILHATPPFVTGVTYIDQWYNNAPDSANATHITLASGGTVVADFQLARVGQPQGVQGTIDGMVVDDLTQAPIPHVRIFFFRTSAVYNVLPVAETGTNGHYSATLDTGTYKLRAQPPFGTISTPGYQPEWYDNVATPQQATNVIVAEGSTFTANFGLTKNTLPERVSVEGAVTDESTGKPIPNAVVVFMRSIQEMNQLGATSGSVPGLGDECMDVQGIGFCRGVIWKGTTDTLGRYHADLVKGNSYIALASASGYIPEFYDNKPGPLVANIIEATGNLTGINWSLAHVPTLSYSMSGRVRDSAGDGVPSRIVLIPVQAPPTLRSCLFANAGGDGTYSIGNVQAGKYLVLAIPFSNYAPAFYKAGAYGVIRWHDADVVNLTADMSGIDIGVVRMALRGFARLMGKTLDPAQLAIAGATVVATTAQGEVLGFGLSDGGGNYSLDGIGTGQLTLVAYREGYEETQMPVTVTPTTMTGEVEFTMSPVQVTSVLPADQLPLSTEIYQNYPNPFNPNTTLKFSLRTPGMVRLSICNVLGQEVKMLIEGMYSAGVHVAVWNGEDYGGRSVASGIYFCKLSVTGSPGASAFSQVRKMVMLK